MEIEKLLFKLQDKKYKDFQSKLLPNIDNDSIIGVRVPDIRKLSKELSGSRDAIEFLQDLPHKFYDENILHGVIISDIRVYEECINELEIFLPYIDNWAVCDIISSKVFKYNKDALLVKIYEWIYSEHIYISRFGIKMLMTHFLDEDFEVKFLKIPIDIHTDEYYLKMMIAWFYATALAKQWDDAIIILENRVLDKWIHNKTIQKARESLRITKIQKEYLKTLKIK